MQLVSRDRHRLHAQMAKIDRQLADHLNRIGVDRNVFGPADSDHLGNRLQHTRFVVGEHHAYQPGVGRDHGVQPADIDDAISVDRQ